MNLESRFYTQLDRNTPWLITGRRQKHRGALVMIFCYIHVFMLLAWCDNQVSTNIYCNLVFLTFRMILSFCAQIRVRNHRKVKLLLTSVYWLFNLSDLFCFENFLLSLWELWDDLQHIVCLSPVSLLKSAHEGKEHIECTKALKWILDCRGNENTAVFTHSSGNEVIMRSLLSICSQYILYLFQITC